MIFKLPREITAKDAADSWTFCYTSEFTSASNSSGICIWKPRKRKGAKEHEGQNGGTR